MTKNAINYADTRAEAIAALREWARSMVRDNGMAVGNVHYGLTSAMDALVQEFRTEFDVPGVRYWEHPESDCFFTTAPGEKLGDAGQEAGHCVELARHEYLSRQLLHGKYEDDRL